MCDLGKNLDVILALFFVEYCFGIFSFVGSFVSTNTNSLSLVTLNVRALKEDFFILETETEDQNMKKMTGVSRQSYILMASGSGMSKVAVTKGNRTIWRIEKLSICGLYFRTFSTFDKKILRSRT